MLDDVDFGSGEAGVGRQSRTRPRYLPVVVGACVVLAGALVTATVAIRSASGKVAEISSSAAPSPDVSASEARSAFDLRFSGIHDGVAGLGDEVMVIMVGLVENTSDDDVYLSEIPTFAADGGKGFVVSLADSRDIVRKGSSVQVTWEGYVPYGSPALKVLAQGDATFDESDFSSTLSEVNGLVDEETKSHAAEVAEADRKKSEAEAKAKAEAEAEAKRKAEEEAAAKKAAEEEAKKKAEEEAKAREAAAAAAAEELSRRATASSDARVFDMAPNYAVDNETAWVDAWAAAIDGYLERRGDVPLRGYGRAFAQAAWDHGCDPRISVCISETESGNGQICFMPYNAWGWLGQSFSSFEEGIDKHAEYLSSFYGMPFSIEQYSTYCGGENTQYLWDWIWSSASTIVP